VLFFEIPQPHKGYLSAPNPSKKENRNQYFGIQICEKNNNLMDCYLGRARELFIQTLCTD
ncbi:MAG: hypothetical protein AAFY33_18240, partial [Cyanobacteria bacterium J06643_4]